MAVKKLKVALSEDANTADGILAQSANLGMPYGMFSHSSSLTVASATTAYKVAFNTDVYKHHITHSTSVNNSQITIDEAGAYLITVSAITDDTAADGSHLELWLAVNNTNVANSNTIVQLPTKTNEAILAVSFIYTFTAGQYFELVYRGDVTTVRFVATAAASSPTRPACPSIICTVNKISR
jgi:hypothetical protein